MLLHLGMLSNLWQTEHDSTLCGIIAILVSREIRSFATIVLTKIVLWNPELHRRWNVPSSSKGKQGIQYVLQASVVAYKSDITLPKAKSSRKQLHQGFVRIDRIDQSIGVVVKVYQSYAAVAFRVPTILRR